MARRARPQCGNTWQEQVVTDSATLTPPRLPDAARLLDPVRRLMESRLDSGPSDGQLLDRFILQRDHQAFASLVHRHGPMVLGVCRRIVGNAHDADDAFQATFLVLVRRADSIRPREMVGPWLHGVAYRTALAARHRAARRLIREKPMDDMQDVMGRTPEAVEAWPELDHAIHRLPEVYRKPVVLCELQGTSRREAARLLGVAEGTLSSRLASARKRLARQLRRRGVLNSVAVSSLVLFPSLTSADVPLALAASTLRLAEVATSHAAAAGLPPALVQLSNGAMRSMFLSKCKSLVGTAVLVGCLGGGAALLAGPIDPQPADPTLQQQDRRRQDDQGSQQGQRRQGDQNRPGRQGQQHKGAQQGDRHGQHQHDGDKHQHGSNREIIEGSGNIITETRKISGVGGIKFTMVGNVTIKQSGREALTITGDDNILKLIDSNVDESTLTLSLNKKDINLRPSQKIEFVVEVKSLSKLEQFGAADMNLIDFNGKELTVLNGGAGNVKLSGKATKLHLDLSGAGNMNAEKFAAKDVVVDLKGAGDIQVQASDSLEANIFGAGSIHYHGSPNVKKTIRGAGSVKPAKGSKTSVDA
jgi:RNA polymerase sigma factor (sigma-70 family)